MLSHREKISKVQTIRRNLVFLKRRSSAHFSSRVFKIHNKQEHHHYQNKPSAKKEKKWQVRAARGLL